jgi:hypothetical protein
MEAWRHGGMEAWRHGRELPSSSRRDRIIIALDVIGGRKGRKVLSFKF